jgi:hypothetical protein
MVKTYHPDILSDEDDLGFLGKQCHPMCSSQLLSVLSTNPFTMVVHLPHTSDSLAVVDKLLIERLSQGWIRNV